MRTSKHKQFCLDQSINSGCVCINKIIQPQAKPTIEQMQTVIDLLSDGKQALLEAAKYALSVSCDRAHNSKRKWTDRDQTAHERLSKAIALAEGVKS